MEPVAPFREVTLSLADLVGDDYVAAVCEARAWLCGEPVEQLVARARGRVEWYPAAWHRRLLELLPAVGQPVCRPAQGTAKGATTRACAAAGHPESAPLSGGGFYRVGEDGRLYLLTKSEHYHAPVGHAFPGYQLLETARRLGIPNATHNNTRGHITRLLEEALVRGAGGQGAGLDRVLNLETGSLAVEAGLKMMLARFYRVDAERPAPPYAGRVPVFLVVGDNGGELQANYHGTTVLEQMLRGMWPELRARGAEAGLWQVAAVRPNSLEDLREAFERHEQAPHKLAGFVHEIVMMNYGARRLTGEFLQQAYALCAAHDVPTLADEIQSCLWAPELFLFREYGLRPDMVALGKGFPGGEYAASRLLLGEEMDCLPQFGALVTNGQEELASLAYLITMRWAQANAEVTREIGEYYEERLAELAARYPGQLAGVTGQRHLAGLEFHGVEEARACTGRLNAAGLDISTQTYKADCPPVALTKLPLTACRTVVEFVVGRMAEALEAGGGE